MIEIKPRPRWSLAGRLLVSIAATLAAGVLIAATAAAKTVELHNYNGVYPAGSWQANDAVGAPPFSTGSLEKLDVDKQTGTVYVGSNSGRIYKFSAAGASQAFTSVAPNTYIPQSINSLGDVEVDNSGTATQGRIYAFPEFGPINAYDPSGAAVTGTSFPLGNIGDVCGAAVSADGHFWRHTWNQGATEYDSNGVVTGVAPNLNPSGYCDFDMDAQGNFYAPSTYTGGPIRKYSPSGTFLYELDPGPSVAVAVDYSNNDVFVDVGTLVRHYTSTGQLLETFATPSGPYPGIAASRGIAVNSQTHTVYVTSNASPTRVDTFVSTGPVVIPDVTTGAANLITRTGATLTGTLNPDGVATTECKFEYGLTTSYSNSANCAEGNVFTGSSNNPVTAVVSGLAGGTLYHYRLVAKNANGTSTASDGTFTTLPAVKDTVTKPATNLTRTTATLNGSFDPDGISTSYYFEYGTTTSYGTKIPLPAPPGENVGSVAGTKEVSQNISGLTLGTLYHYRVVAENAVGKTNGADQTFTTVSAVKNTLTKPASNLTRTTATLNGSFDADGIATNYYFEYGKTTSYGTKIPLPAPPGENVGTPVGTYEASQNISGLEPGTLYHYRIVAENGTYGKTNGADVTFTTVLAVKSTATEPATNITATSATLNGVFDPDGLSTTYYFQYGKTMSYGSFAPVAPPGAAGGATFGVKPVSAAVAGLEPGKTYNFRLVAINSFGTTLGNNRSFVANDVPTIVNDTARSVNTDGAILSGEVNPNALTTTYHFEYGSEPCSSSACVSSAAQELSGTTAQVASVPWTGLTPGQTYYFRIIASNARGTTTGVDRKVRTYLPDPGSDSCSNAEVRIQTGASLLLDCRAYELASTTNSGGYDVESDLVPGQTPLAAYPEAGDRVMYSVHSGVIPGVAGNPTNFGPDPYVASRGDHGWTTEYVGLPSDGMADEDSYGSPLLGADKSLRLFAFGGKDICEPCFAGPSRNIPLRLTDGSIVKGMAGALNPNAAPVGFVAMRFSGDGTHFVFGADKKFETSGKEGSLSIYDRDLVGGTTQVVSTLPGGATMGGEVGELGVSEDGSRIVVGQKISTDAAGNSYWHPYMHVGSSASSIDLAPGTTTGVLYAGMTSDGSKVFFASKDKLAGTDTDESADLYQATVPSGGPAVVTRLSTGAPPPVGDTNTCDPTSNADGNNWNAVGGASANSCGVVAIAGGGGVGVEDGTVYFLSPEPLDGEGTLNEPNLFVVTPGSTPHYVATLEPNNPVVRNGVADSEVHRYGDFQVSTDGEFAAFDSKLSLTGANNGGHDEVFRYAVATDAVDCASCSPSFASPLSDTVLPPYGLSVTDGGEVFFTTAEPLVLRDTNGKKDAYEWQDGTVQLISRGIGAEDSGMLSVTADGTNAFFFTRDTLVPEDVNGSTVKIYDARANGGFLYDPPSFPCAASDECHGAGTQAPPAAVINTVKGSGRASVPTQGARRCKRGKVRRQGKCVKRHRSKQRKQRPTTHRNG